MARVDVIQDPSLSHGYAGPLPNEMAFGDLDMAYSFEATSIGWLNASEPPGPGSALVLSGRRTLPGSDFPRAWLPLFGVLCQRVDLAPHTEAFGTPGGVPEADRGARGCLRTWGGWGTLILEAGTCCLGSGSSDPGREEQRQEQGCRAWSEG